MTLYLMLALCLHQILAQNFVNQYDGVLDFRCPQGKYISKMYSVHNSHHEDRRFAFECRSGIVGSSCFETGWVNNYDGLMNYERGDAGLVGFYSVHNSHREDRIFKFRYCKFKNPQIKCKSTFWSGAINNYDHEMNYPVPRGHIILGAYGYHNSHKEDRLWNLKLCEMAVCTVRGVTYDRIIEAKKQESRIVGVQTTKGCSQDASSFQFSYTRKSEVTESTTITTSKTFSWNVATTIYAKISKKVSAGVVDVTKEAGFSLTAGVGGSKTDTKSKTISLTQSSSGQTTWTFKTPKAVLMMGIVNVYRFDEQDVPVTLDVVCDNGDSFPVKDTMSIKAHSFGHVHISTITGVPPAERCRGSSLNTCLRHIETQFAFHEDKIEKQFKQCVAEKTNHPINGNWGSWSSWSSCNKQCGGGSQARTRQCNNPAPANGGNGCSGSTLSRRSCNTQTCSVNGGWSAWEYDDCNQQTGKRLESRICNNPTPQNGGLPCAGSPTTTADCKPAKINAIQVKTSDDQYAGCEYPSCKLTLRVFSSKDSCTHDLSYKILDNGSLATFGAGACWSKIYDTDLDFSVTISHKGTDGWISDWVRVRFDNGKTIQCDMGKEVLKEAAGKKEVTRSCFSK